MGTISIEVHQMLYKPLDLPMTKISFATSASVFTASVGAPQDKGATPKMAEGPARFEITVDVVCALVIDDIRIR